MKAFIGEPADANGNRIPCARCDRLARQLVGPDREPRCMRHLTDTLPADQQREADAAKRAKFKERVERR